MSAAAESGSAESSMTMASLPPISAITRLTQRWFSICLAASSFILSPVLSVIKASDFDEALRLANDRPYGLTGGVYSRNRDNLERARREFKAGNVYFNRGITGALVGVQPFGGFGMSGTDSKAGGPDYLPLHMLARTVVERF